MFFGSWQKDNVSNQREHIIHLLANEQSRLGIPEDPEPVGVKLCGLLLALFFESVLY